MRRCKPVVSSNAACSHWVVSSTANVYHGSPFTGNSNKRWSVSIFQRHDEWRCRSKIEINNLLHAVCKTPDLHACRMPSYRVACCSFMYVLVTAKIDSMRLEFGLSRVNWGCRSSGGQGRSPLRLASVRRLKRTSTTKSALLYSRYLENWGCFISTVHNGLFGGGNEKDYYFELESQTSHPHKRNAGFASLAIEGLTVT